MKLFVKNNGRKVYLKYLAQTRFELRRILGSDHFFVGQRYYSVRDVMAEPDSAGNTVSGAVIGGVLGAVLGPGGAFFGGLLGGAIGNSSEEEDRRKVKIFNDSP